ncbi:hypothetical protein AY600_04785 [Phormidium willei BDU 130791]|nr:hypothetical protein AY600_04785 [Phormidium willei BDU 130791]
MNHPTIEDIYPLSPLQQGLLFHSLYAPESGVYVEQLALEIQGQLDWEVLEEAWQASVDRHGILRTAFVWDNLDHPLQVVGRQARLRLQQEDWQALDPQERSVALVQWLEGDRRRGFVLSKAPLMRLTRLHLGPNEDYLVWTHHHLLLDGWSASRLLQEVWQQYQGRCQGRTPSLAPVRPYRDYIDWLQRQDTRAAQGFWQAYLQGITAPTPLRLGPAGWRDGLSHGQETRSLSAAKSEQYRQFARQQGLTVNTCLQGLWALLLARYSGVSEVVFGTTVSGRSPQLPGSETILGLLINTLPVRCRVTPEQPLIPWLQALQRQQAEARQYDYTPLTQIQDWSNFDANTPLFDSLLVVENYPVALRSEDADMSIRPIQAIEQTNYPLMIVAEPGDRLTLKFIYDRSQFGDEAMARLATQVETLLSQMLERDNPRLGELEMLSQEEQQQLLQEWNQTQTSFPESTLVGLVEDQVQRTPEAVAVLFEDQQLTYRQLNEDAERLGQQLHQLGIRPEMRVAVALRRSPQLLIALLAILKTGAAYIPLDPNYPQDRLTFILQDSQPALVLTESQVRSQLPQLPDIPVVDLDGINLETATGTFSQTPTPEALAYLIYTSGSTGQPKGVAIEQRSVANFLQSLQAHLRLSESDRLLAITTLSFDIAVLELFLPLTVGAQVQILPDCLSRDGSQLAQALNQSQVTVMQATPATWQMLLSAGWSGKEGLMLLCGGEALSRDLAAQLVGKGEALWNLYGPTETTIWSTLHRVQAIDETIPIGRPIHNTQVYVLDINQQPVPIGVPGELYLGGAGLAREYWRRPELTRERFLDLAWGRLYRTGDLVRYREDGVLEHLGRLDHQVKLRGYRIELGEIESQLRSHPQVNNAVVIAREDEPGQRRLVAYIVGDLSQEDLGSKLRRHLQAQLPDYMVPSLFVALDELPLTPNGKIDRRALPKPCRDLSASTTVSPQTDLERQIATVWQDLLNLEELGREENFFELGGHSLLATQAISRLRQRLEQDLPLRLLFDAPTVARLAAAISPDESKTESASPVLPTLRRCDRQQPLPLSFAQERLWVLDRLNPGDCSYLIATAIDMQGLVQVEALQRSLDTLIVRHESLRTTFVMVDGHPRQEIAPQLTVPIITEDLRHLSPEKQAQWVQQRQDELVQHPFDLETGPLLRVRLLRLEDERSQLLVCLHHIITDAWSLGILIREMTHCYEAFARQESPSLPPLPIQYADFAVWQRHWLQGPSDAASGQSRLESHLNYWRQQLQPPLPVLSLGETTTSSNRGALESFQLPASLLRSLQQWSQQRGLSLFMTLLTGFYLLLYRESRQKDIVIGTDIANRNYQEVEPLIGFFVNILPLRLRLLGNPTIEDLAQCIRGVTLGAYAHQDLPFAKLVEALNPTRSVNSTPLFQVLFVLQNTPSTSLSCPGLRLTPQEVDNGTAKFDVALFFTETETGLEGLWNYRCDRLTREQIQRFSKDLSDLFNTLIDQPQQHLDDILPKVSNVAPTMKQTKAKTSQLKTSKFKKFKAVQPKPVDSLNQALIKTGQLTSDCPCPLVIQPQQNNVDLADWAQNNRPWLETQLQNTGAILFRDFSVTSASEFEQVAQAICPQLFAEYGDLPREDVGGKVYGSTPYPAEQAIRFHNESSHLPRWPQKIWFCCLQPATTGGETPIVDCREAYRNLSPELRQELQSKKLMYVRNFTDGLDVSWQDFFQTGDRQVVEAQCQQQQIHVEWTERGLRTRQIRPAIVPHPKTQDWLLFNQIQLHHIAYLEPSVRQSLVSLFGEAYLPRHVYYGDGSPLDDRVLTALDAAYTAAKIQFSWKKGDILMLDNMRMAHGRNPFSGSRKIVVTMGDMMTDLDLSFTSSANKSIAQV